MTEERCQKCGSDNLIYLGHIKIITGSDDNVNFICCAACGQIQGEFPLVCVFEEMLKNKVNELNDMLAKIYRQNIDVKLELKYSDCQDESGRVSLRLNEIRRAGQILPPGTIA